ncbi:MAG: recombinase family protein [Verrucomicrobiia bacterium]
MPKAYSYIRFSTPEQLKGDSLRRQLQLSEDYAKKHGLVLDTTFKLQDLGVSGFTRENVTKGALGVFLEAVQKHLIPKGSYLLVESLDRLSRAQITKQMTMFMGIINEGITIVTLGDGMVYSEDRINDNFAGLMYSLMVMSRSHEESATKSKRLKAAWDNKRKRGGVLTALAPAWLDFDRNKREFVPIQARGELVRRMFTMADRGKGQATIAKTFNEERIPVWGRGKGWHSSYIQKILQNRSVIGEYQPHHMQEGKRVPVGELVADYFPAVVSKELFARVQAKRKSNRRFIGKHGKSGVSNLFTGLAYCAYSNAPMVYVNKGKSWKYLVSDSARRGRGDHYQSWDYSHFETAFLTFIREVDFSQLLKDSNTDRDARLADMENVLLLKKDELDGVEKQLKRLVTALREGGASFNSIKDEIAALERQKSELEKQILEQGEKLEDQKQVAEHFRQAGASLKKLFQRKGDPDFRYQLRAEIRNQVERIDVYPGGFHWTKAMSEKLFPKVSGRHDMLNRMFLHRLMRAGYIAVSDEVRKCLEEHRKLPAWNDRLAKEAPPVDKKGRLFIVFFKDGSGRLVKPDFKDPNRLAPVREERGGGVFDVGITPAGIMMAMQSSSGD